VRGVDGPAFPMQSSARPDREPIGSSSREAQSIGGARVFHLRVGGLILGSRIVMYALSCGVR